MKDVKRQYKLEGDEYWPILPMVTVPEGDPTAQSIAEGATQVQGEKTVQTWQRVAVLQVEPAGASVMVGFLAGDHMQYLNVPVQQAPEGKFGVRVGDGPVKFFLNPVDGVSRYGLKLVEVAQMSDPKYTDLPLY